MRDPIADFGAKGIGAVHGLGRFGAFAARVAVALVTPPARLRRTLDELHDVGVLSLAVIGVSGLAVGMVLGLQGYNTLVRFGAEESLGAVVGLSLIRELGPVLSALLVTGRAASAAAAEIASMGVTEQLDGLRMMSIEPVHFVVAPKVVAFVVCMPLLSALFIVLGLAGGYLVGVRLPRGRRRRLRVEPAADGRARRGRRPEPRQVGRLRRARRPDRGLPGLPRRAALGGREPGDDLDGRRGLGDDARSSTTS